MISEKIRKEIESAVAKPNDYLKGASLGRLRAAFDAMWSQICHEVIGSEARNRMMARKLLNDSLKSDNKHESRDLIQALSAALRECEHTLFRKDYIDHSGSIVKFITRELCDVLRSLP